MSKPTAWLSNFFGKRTAPGSKNQSDDDKVKTLTELGCTHDEALSLLTHYHGDVERAADYFLRTQHQEHVHVPSVHDPVIIIGDSAASVQSKGKKSQTRGVVIPSMSDTNTTFVTHQHHNVKASPVSNSAKSIASAKQEGMLNGRNAPTSNPAKKPQKVSKKTSVDGAIAMRSEKQHRNTAMNDQDGALVSHAYGSEHSFVIPASTVSWQTQSIASPPRNSAGPEGEVVRVYSYHQSDRSPPSPTGAWGSHENNNSITTSRTISKTVEICQPRPKSPPFWYQDTVVELLPTTQSTSSYQDSTQVHSVEIYDDAITIDETGTLPIQAPTVAMLPPSDAPTQQLPDSTKSAQATNMPEDQEEAPMIWHCTTSQYSFEQGRSACTCIALCAATSFLRNPTMSSEFLEHMILDGVHTYLSISQSFPVEHLNVEEVLQADANGTIFPLQLFPGGVRQGVLSYDCDHPLGLRALLHGIQQEKDAMIPYQWLALLLTKTPETVLVCLPPQSNINTNDGDNDGDNNKNQVQQQQYYLIDSHPRPQQGVGNAYALVHSSLDSLIGSLQNIFPYTYMEPDTPEMMAMMYNSFDVYPLTLRPDTGTK